MCSETATIADIDQIKSFMNFLHDLTYFTQFPANVPLLDPLKTSENFWFSNVSRSYRIRALAGNEVKIKHAKARKIPKQPLSNF